MGKASTAAKRKYNKSAYVRYEFSVRIDSSLAYKLEEEKANSVNISAVIKQLLCEHYGVADDDLHVPEHFKRPWAEKSEL